VCGVVCVVCVMWCVWFVVWCVWCGVRAELNPNGVIFKHSMSECCAIFKHALRMNAV